MCDKAVDDYLASLKLIPDCFVTSKIVEKFSALLYSEENILNFYKDSGHPVFSFNEMGILGVYLNIIR